MNKSSFIVKKPFSMDDKENHFYRILFHSVGNDFYIWPKVKIHDLLEFKNDTGNQNLRDKFNQLAQKHVDFILCNKENFHPLLIVRFKGMLSHQDEVFHTEENILKEILHDTNIPILEESATELDSYKTSYELETLKVRILEALDNTEL